MAERSGLITGGVLVAYICLVAVVFRYVPAPWSVVVAMLIGMKAAIFFTVIRRVRPIGTKNPGDARPVK